MQLNSVTTGFVAERERNVAKACANIEQGERPKAMGTLLCESFACFGQHGACTTEQCIRERNIFQRLRRNGRRKCGIIKKFESPINIDQLAHYRPSCAYPPR